MADENIDAPLVAWLRERGHDVQWVAQTQPGLDDEAVTAEARRTDRILLTADLDFGEHVFQRGGVLSGVVLLRLRVASPDELLERMGEVWPKVEEKLPGSFVVVSNEKLRVRPLPDAPDE